MKKFLLLLLVACGPTTPHPRPFEGEATCETACTNLQRMGCEAAQPSDGTTCTELCEELVDYGAPYPVRCVTEASTCLGADSCQ